MRIVRATFVNNEVEPGWAILDESIPLGKRYDVDLDDVQPLTMTNTVTRKSVQVEAIMVVERGWRVGYLPLVALKVEGDA